MCWVQLETPQPLFCCWQEGLRGKLSGVSHSCKDLGQIYFIFLICVTLWVPILPVNDCLEYIFVHQTQLNLAFFSVSWTNTSFQRPVTQKVRCFTSKWRETTSDIWLRWLLVTLALVSFSLVLLVIVAFFCLILCKVYDAFFCLLDWSGFNYIKLFYISMYLCWVLLLATKNWLICISNDVSVS